jgi:Ca-activated chloride channel family protein
VTFSHPGWLLAGVVACICLLWIWNRYEARQHAALARFVSAHLRKQLTLSVSVGRRRVRRGLQLAALALLFGALAEPLAGYHWELISRRGNEIIFAVDTSRSMSTPDVRPDRLTRAKLAIDDFTNKLDGDAVGLVAFAGTAFLVCPITLDYGAFHESLAALDTNIIPRGGTNITSAIHEAQGALQNRPGSDKILILVTDGEDLEGDSLTAAKAAAAQDGLKIFTVGVGTANGDLIPLPAAQGGGFLKDTEGHLVKSRLDEAALKALAAATGGTYAPLGAQNQGLETIYQQALAPLAKHDLESRAQRVYTERFQWPLGLSLALLLSSLVVGTRRRVASERPASEHERSFRRLAMPTSAALIGLCWLLPLHSARASPASAAVAYAHGDFAAAAQDYSASLARNPKQPLLQFDAGAAAYKAGEFPQAAEAFKASVNASESGNSKRLAEQQDAYYNLGNTHYRVGQKTEQSNAAETIENWSQALKAYDAALQLRADDADAKFNRDLVKRKLDALRKQSQQQQSKESQSQSSEPQQGQGQGQGPARKSKDDSAQSKQAQQRNQSKPQGSGQQQQAQTGAGQSGDGQKTPTQPGGTAAPDQAQQAGQKNEPSPAEEGATPRPDRAQGGHASSGEQLAKAADDQRLPGQMSRQEASELLDSVKDEERRLPVAPLARSGPDDSGSNDPLKDW